MIRKSLKIKNWVSVKPFSTFWYLLLEYFLIHIFDNIWIDIKKIVEVDQEAQIIKEKTKIVSIIIVIKEDKEAVRIVKDDKVVIDIEIQAQRKKRDIIHHNLPAVEAVMEVKEVKIVI